MADDVDVDLIYCKPELVLNFVSRCNIRLLEYMMVSKMKFPDEGISCTSSVRYQRPDALNVSSLMDPEVTLWTIPPRNNVQVPAETVSVVAFFQLLIDPEEDLTLKYKDVR